MGLRGGPGKQRSLRRSARIRYGFPITGEHSTAPTVHTNTSKYIYNIYIYIPYFYQQHLVLFTVIPRNNYKKDPSVCSGVILAQINCFSMRRNFTSVPVWCWPLRPAPTWNGTRKPARTCNGLEAPTRASTDTGLQSRAG